MQVQIPETTLQVVKRPYNQVRKTREIFLGTGNFIVVVERETSIAQNRISAIAYWSTYATFKM